jgi:hypothetical protein
LDLFRLVENLMELDKHLTLSLMQLVEIKFETSFGGMTLFFEVQ